jgi:hypothetical protein
MHLIAAPGPWHYLDPDNRKTPPADTWLYCCRCMKDLRGRGGTCVEVDKHGAWVRLNIMGRQFIGSECHKITFKEDNIVPPEHLEQCKNL